MREKKTIREQVGTPAGNVAVVLLFFGAVLVCMWALIAIVRLVMG